MVVGGLIFVGLFVSGLVITLSLCKVASDTDDAMDKLVQQEVTYNQNIEYIEK